MGILIAATVVSVLFGMLSRQMASTRHRSQLPWFFLGLFFGPISPLILLILGDVNSKPLA